MIVCHELPVFEGPTSRNEVLRFCGELIDRDTDGDGQTAVLYACAKPASILATVVPLNPDDPATEQTM